MSKIRLGLAGIFSLLTIGSASAQFPTVPPNSVIGRLGNGNSGPSEFIPFATLSAQLGAVGKFVVGPPTTTVGHLSLWANILGTGLSDFAGTSGGIPYFNSGGGIGSSALLTLNGPVIGGGAGATPATVTPGINNQAFMGSTGAAPSFRALVGADLPNPSASTIGGVQSAAAVTHQWINSISTSGVPALSQPAFSDISSQATFAQFPTGGATDTVIGYWASTVASAIAISNCSNALTYSTSTHAFGCNSTAGTGTVTSVAANAGVVASPSPITSTGTVTADGNYSGWALSNCTLAASVASNILTVALKDNAGNDPSATSPCNINYRNVTATVGSTTLVQQTAALSISTNATGATLATVANTAFRFWVVVFNNGGTNVLALINCSRVTTTAASIFPLNEHLAASSTPISGSATSAGVFYTPNGTTVTSGMFRIVGYVEYNSTGLATAGNYATAPNFVQVMGPGIHRPGETVAKFSNTTSTVGTTSSASYAALSSGQTQAISPTSAANPIHALAAGTANDANTAGGVFVQIARGSTLIGSIAGANTTGSTWVTTAMEAYDLPNTTGSTTYAIFGKCSGCTTLSYPLSGNAAILTVEEIMGALPDVIPDNDNDPRLVNKVA
jgi:hypothetical protein